MRRIGCFSVFFALLCGIVSAAPLPSNANELLRRSDQARGGGLPGLVWLVDLKNFGDDADVQTDMRLRVEAIESASLAIVESPPKNKGWVMLQVERNMWLSKPELKKPVPVSPRQRLSGQVAIGDIAATNYARDYEARYVRTETFGGIPCQVLDLRAKTRSATYDHIRYWISEEQGLAVRAEYISLLDKVLKTATFAYGHRIDGPKGAILFISRMEVTDALSGARTTLDYRSVHIRSIPRGRFDPDSL